MKFLVMFEDSQKDRKRNNQRTTCTESSQIAVENQIDQSDLFLNEVYVADGQHRQNFGYIQPNAQLRQPENVNPNEEIVQADENSLHQPKEFQAIGKTRAYWKIQGEFYYKQGTAFAISPRLIVTCQHNIFDEEYKYATKITFSPGKYNAIIKKRKTYKSVQNNYFKTIPLNNQQTLKEHPTINQLCLIVLEQKLILQRYIKIESHDSSIKLQGLKLQNVGYPSQNVLNQENLVRIKAYRVHLKGQLLSISDCIIVHNMKTEKGHSGSPILAMKGQEIRAIGIHSHGSQQPGVKLGLFINGQVLKKIQQFKKELQEQFELANSQDYPIEMLYSSMMSISQEWSVYQSSIEDSFTLKVLDQVLQGMKAEF